MAQQAELFPSLATTIEVDENRGEPRLWVRRLVLWEKPSEVIREIKLRRGLNIVWSPDPGASEADLGRSGGSGHGAGKSLFCRLLRYCLGEETFANDQLHASIANEFPEGIVGAEVVIKGNTWGVVRPLGATRKHLACEGVSPEELLEHGAQESGMRPLLEAITKRILPDGIDANMPGHKEWKSWLLALAWLARDQECRFSGLLDWRDPKSDSRSSVPGISKEELVVVVRSFLDVMSGAEMKIREQLEEVSRQKQSLEHKASDFNRRTEQLGSELADALGSDADILGAQVLAASAICQKGDEQLRAVEEELEQDAISSELPPLREKLETVMKQLGVISEQQERAEGMLSIQEEQIKALRGERANLDAEEIKARLGPVCPVCNVSIDQALAEGCGLSHVIPDLESIVDDKVRAGAQIDKCQQVIATYQQQKSERASIRQGLEAQETSLRQQIKNTERKIAKRRNELRQQWYDARSLAEKARKLSTLYRETSNVEQQIEQLSEKEKGLKEQRQSHQMQHRELINRFGELFSYVCKGMLGSEIESNLNFTAQGIRAEVQVGGAAMDSLKAIAFDLATLLMSIEGRTGLPAFLIHDSPREADLGLSLYHRLFRFIAELEGVATEPPFQYILTTTTEPPEELRKPPYVVAQLSGAIESERLLRKDLRMAT